LWTVCLGWLQKVIFLISVSWVPRITGVSQQCLASYFLTANWNLIFSLGIHHYLSSDPQFLKINNITSSFSSYFSVSLF
jgi:hypothetical protein